MKKRTNNFNIAIDMGSKYVSIYKSGVGVVLKEPSLIAIDSLNKSDSVCGMQAYNLIGKTNYQMSVVSPIGQGAIVDMKNAKVMLKMMIDGLISSGVLPKKNSALFILPCGLTPTEQKEFFTLGYGVGFSKVGIVPALIPALINMGIKEDDNQAHMLVSLGYAICDLAVIHGLNIVKGGTINLGGKTIAEAISDFIASKYNMAVSSEECVKVLSKVATLIPNDIRSCEFEGLDITTKRYKSNVIYSSDLYPIVAKCVDKIADVIETVLNMCSPDIIADIHKAGIYLCGGSSNITGIEPYLTEKVGYKVFVDVEPDNTLIYGGGALINNPALASKLIKTEC